MSVQLSETTDRKALILVIDGFGVGAMPDAGELRPEDARANTLASLARWSLTNLGRRLAVPNLATLGLAVLCPQVQLAAQISAGYVGSTVCRSALGYPGADTFAGHQTMMGADMSHVVMCRVGQRLSELSAALKAAGHRVELFQGDKPLLVVDGVALVHDNLEADPALNWNVSARLDELSWEKLLEIAQIVREHSPVARVIAVGGYSERPLADSVRLGAGGTIGLDTPASGFYRLGGLQVRHLGVYVDRDRQLPQLADSAKLPVTLVGKAADILVARGADYRPGVETEQVLTDTRFGIARGGLSVANVQQTDLAGHQQDPGRFVAVLEQVDAAIPTLLAELGENGLLVVTGDHGNDPSIGHPFHTREFTPVLAARGSAKAVSSGLKPKTAQRMDDFGSLADLGASVASWLGLDASRLESGSPKNLLV